MSIVGLWMGWPPFDIHICKLEMEQCLNACDIDQAANRLLSENDEDQSRFEHVHKGIERAERVIESVAFVQMEEAKDEIDEKSVCPRCISTLRNSIVM